MSGLFKDRKVTVQCDWVAQGKDVQVECTIGSRGLTLAGNITLIGISTSEEEAEPF